MMTANELRQYYSSEDFKETYSYDGKDLGVECRGGRTVFKLWSPLSEQIELYLYPDGGQSAAFAHFPMQAEEQGVWSFVVEENLHGTYYDYRIHVNGGQKRSADPYAKACGINGKRSMAVDLARTNPDGWEQDCAPVKSTEQIIYEVHVKEFSWDESAGFSKKGRGKYKGFMEENTTLYGDGIHPTGIRYLEKLGITHVQLMPVFDYGSVDEGGSDQQFNWGYDPVNYNVPEGSYATDPAHGEVRIRELKEVIMSLHQKGFRVIMDVVYNHTHSADSWFQRVVPWYYYRQNEDGSLSDGSGCGNDIASERKMCGQYILDSISYWAQEYHMDGFRFDLMGLLNVELMNDIQDELDDRFGVGEKLIFGEPWAADSSPMEHGFWPALKENVGRLNKRVGIFCDNTRDAIKGHIFETEEVGFVNGGKGFEEDILQGVSAWCDGDGILAAKGPSQVITYISSHDNLTLWDKLVMTLHPGGNFHEMYGDVMSTYKLAAAIYFTCQGTLFMLSGEEFARTKRGLDNSYDAPVDINRLDYKRAYENEDLLSYYEGLIALRKQLPGLYDKSVQAGKRISKKRIEADGVVSFRVDNRDGTNGSRWIELFVVYNRCNEPFTVELPRGDWQVLVDQKSSKHWHDNIEVTGNIKICPVSAVVLGRKDGVDNSI